MKLSFAVVLSSALVAGPAYAQPLSNRPTVNERTPLRSTTGLMRR